jgi:hypothetical protein
VRAGNILNSGPSLLSIGFSPPPISRKLSLYL